MKILDFFNKEESFLNFDILNLKFSSYIEDMKNCQQNPAYHGEGSVWTHTSMVHSALIQLPEFVSLTLKEQQILELSAFFHDIAKPTCTVIENGKISSPRHAKIGEKITRRLLWDMDFYERERICAIVRFHGLPIWAIDKSNPTLEVMKASLRVSNKLIYIFAKADITGRICSDSDRAEMMERIEWYKEFCQEKQVWEYLPNFENGHSRFKTFSKNCEFPIHIYDDTEFTVYLMCGIPGSGKDYYSTQYSKNLNIPVISLDDLREKFKIPHSDKKGQGFIIQEAQKQAKEYCAKKQSFIWNATNLTVENRQKIINLLSVYNPSFEIIYVETSFKKILERRADIINREVLEQMLEKIEIPFENEAHGINYFIHK